MDNLTTMDAAFEAWVAERRQNDGFPYEHLITAKEAFAAGWKVCEKTHDENLKALLDKLDCC